MFRKFASRTYCALLLSLSLFISGCRHKDELTDPSDDHFVDANKMVVYETDSTEWNVCLVATGKLYADAVQVSLPAPYRLPTRDEAQILKTLTYPHDERFVTSDGYTFAMPSPSVTKAGTKTKYSVLGLWIRVTVIDCPY